MRVLGRVLGRVSGRVLGLDAATMDCSVAVVEEDRLLCDYRLKTGYLQAEHLLVLIDRAMKDLKTTLEEMDGVALTIGPGSFTGLRVAVSTVKGWMAVAPKPVVPVSTLEALAWSAPHSPHPISPWLDAKKGEVYAALFHWEASGELKRRMEDRVIAPRDLLAQLSGPTLFVGEGVEPYRDLIEGRLGRDARIIAPTEQRSLASVVASLGVGRLRRGEAVDSGRLVPVYLRRAEAELNLERKMSGRSGSHG